MTTTPIQTPTTTEHQTVNKAKDHSYITSLPTFADRGTAIAKRLEAVKSDPKYAALKPEVQAKVRADIYDKYVPKSYSGFHLPVPNKDTWVGATGRGTAIRDYNIQHVARVQKLSESYNTDLRDQMGKDLVVGATKAWDGIALFGAKVTNKAFSAMHDIDDNFSHNNDGLLAKHIQHVDKVIQRSIGNYVDAQHAKIQSDDFWLQTHPRDTMVGKLASDAGELIATLPLYEAVGSVGAGSKLLKGANLTEKLAVSKTGQFVAKRLTSASDMFLSSLVESGGSTKTAAEGAAGAVVAETALGAAGKVVKVASAPLIKKWTANTIAMGGKPFAQDVVQSAYHEMVEEPWFMKKGDIKDIVIGGQHELTHGIIVHPTTEEAGHFTTRDGQVFKYGNRRQQQLGYNELVKRAEIQRAESNPVMHKLHEAEKASLDSISLAKFKMPLHMLEDKQKLDVLGERWLQINQAAQEAPVHLPDLQKHEVEQSIAEQKATNPMFAQTAKMLEGLGVKIGDAVTDNSLTQIAKETGISNQNGAAKKLGKVTKITKSVGADFNRYADTKDYSVAYYRAARNRTQFNQAVGDRSQANFNNFIGLLKDADRGNIHFENTTQRMLYHYGNRKELPPELSKSLLYRIRQVKGYEKATPKQIQKEADWLHVHLRNFAHSGRLGPETNVYNSTKLDAPFSWTKWQKQLSTEADKATIESARKALAQHPHALKGFDATVKAIQKASYSARTPEEYLTFKRALEESSHSIIAHQTDSKLGGLLQ